MAERNARVAEDEDLPVIDYVAVSDATTVVGHADDFRKDAAELKTFGGTKSAFKRQVTNKINKLRRGKGGAESKEIKEDEFLTGYEAFNVIEPNYNLEYLAQLYEASEPHYAACNAKVANIVGLGYKLVENNKSKRNFERLSDDEEKAKKWRQKLDVTRDNLIDKLEDMNEEDDLTETLSKVWRDYEALGNGYLEIGRNKDNTIGYLGHIPAKTLRMRRERDGFVQISGFKVQFFANFGAGFDDDGQWVGISNPVGNDTPNEIIHIKRYSPTSTFYGVPDIVAAAQAVAGNKFAADYNLDYFENKAVPRYAIILKGATLGNKAEGQLLSFFETSLKGQHHRSIYIPLPGDTIDNKVDLTLQAIETGVQDASFKGYKESNQADILMVHRVPITKISVSGGTGVATARDADKTFKEQVCAPEQTMFEKKVNRVIREFTDALDFSLNEMTLTDENTQSQIDERRRKTGEVTANENRARRGEPAIEGGDELFDMNAALKQAEMADKTARRGQDKQEAAAKETAAAKVPPAGANASGNPAGTRQRDTQRSAQATDSAGEGRNPKGDGRTTP